MHIAFSTSGDSLESPFDSRFGRAPKFLIYNLDDDTYTVIDNEQNLTAAQGAGIQSAQHVANSGAQALITGHLGPKASQVIFAAGIKAYQSDADTVSEALALFRSKALKQMREPDVQGHCV